MDFKKVAIYFIPPIVLIIASQLFRFSDMVLLCSPDDKICAYNYYEALSRPLMIWGKVTVILAILLSILNPTISALVKRIGFIYIVGSALVLAFTPTQCGGFFVSCIDRDFASWLTAGGFLIVTLILLITQRLRSKSNG